MYSSLSLYGAINERTGYGIHCSRLIESLEKKLPVYRNQLGGEASISLIDSVSIQNVNERLPYPSILLNVWESTIQPKWFMDKLKYFDQLWVASEAQRAWSIADGIPEEYVKVVPEGVDPKVYKPSENLIPSDTFDFLVCGQWQHRKSTLEIVQSFLKAFPKNPKVRLYLSCDTLFPSDNYKSTEERLVGNGIFDERIIPVHFEEREDYVRRLQTCNVYVQCSRSEGFGLPGIEAMACGTVSIIEDWGGSTEYSDGALRIRVPKLKVPEGIFGDWKVPGLWGEPDYDHLVATMQDAYNNYDAHKKKALETSDFIRTKFSWQAAAETAYSILEDLSKKEVETPEERIKSYAENLGYEITGLKTKRVAICIDSHPSSQDRIDTLIETIKQVKFTGYPIILTTHLPLPSDIIESVDFHIYDKKDILSGNDTPVYQRRRPNGEIESVSSSIPCAALAGHQNRRNAIDFCRGRFDWIYFMNSDVEVDFKDWLKRVRASDKSVITNHWDGNPETFGGQIIAARVDAIDKIYGRIDTWEEYTNVMGGNRFISERGYYLLAEKEVGLENIEFLDSQYGNRYDQVDYEAFKDDLFECNFIDGPYLNIVGISKREYDVHFTAPDGEHSYSLKQKAGMWSRPSVKYYKDWTVKAFLDGELKFEHTIDLKDKRVLISMGSKALGDTIAWMPYVEEFRKKHGCHIIFSGWWQEIFDYPELEMVKPGTSVENVHATYQIGCFDDQLNLNVKDWRLTNLQKVAADILGLAYEPLKAKLKIPKRGNGIGNKRICFSEFSTMQNKLWNREGAWQNIIDVLKDDYECISVSAEPSQLKNVTKHNSQSIQNTIADINRCEFYVGLNHGPSWIAYALNKPYIMIDGVSEEWNNPPNPYRVAINECKPCFNDTTYKLDRGWDFCPQKKDFICTRNITEQMVLDVIGKLEEDYASKINRTKKVDGNGPTQPGKTLQEEQRSSQDGCGETTPLCRNEREEIATA